MSEDEVEIVGQWTAKELIANLRRRLAEETQQKLHAQREITQYEDYVEEFRRAYDNLNEKNQNNEKRLIEMTEKANEAKQVKDMYRQWFSTCVTEKIELELKAKEYEQENLALKAELYFKDQNHVLALDAAKLEPQAREMYQRLTNSPLHIDMAVQLFNSVRSMFPLPPLLPSEADLLKVQASAPFQMASKKECHVCYREYEETGDLTPRVLPKCGHTFCQYCLTQTFKDGVIECMTCRTSQAVDSVLECPKNYALWD